MNLLLRLNEIISYHLSKKLCDSGFVVVFEALDEGPLQACAESDVDMGAQSLLAQQNIGFILQTPRFSRHVPGVTSTLIKIYD